MTALIEDVRQEKGPRRTLCCVLVRPLRRIADSRPNLALRVLHAHDGASVANLAGYTIVQAESHEAAAKMFLEHPHVTIFPGDAVELMECLPMPPMPD
jgi:hypothetical protein